MHFMSGQAASATKGFTQNLPKWHRNVTNTPRFAKETLKLSHGHKLSQAPPTSQSARLAS